MAQRSISLHARLKWPDVKDDYDIWHEEMPIGRVRLAGDRANEAAAWEWSIVVPMAMPDWARGVGTTRDDCMKDFSAAWARLLKETPPERLGRALDLMRAWLKPKMAAG